MSKALIIVDVQEDFLPGGALGVGGGTTIIPGIVQAADEADVVVATMDWHPSETTHFEVWPAHCVQGTRGANIDQSILDLKPTVFMKGYSHTDDGYSGFEGITWDPVALDRDWVTLAEHLHVRGVTEVAVVGLALDYCVRATALDAVREGFSTTVPLDLTRPVAVSSGNEAVRVLNEAGVRVVAPATRDQ